MYFIKAHSLGNDFIIADSLSRLSKDQLSLLAHRHHGIGCDQFISFEENKRQKVDFTIRFYNADGSFSGACGNGSRAVAGYYMDQHGVDQVSFSVQGRDQEEHLFHAQREGDHIALQMPLPVLTHDDIPVCKTCPDLTKIEFDFLPGLTSMAVSMGNPHNVFIVSDVNAIALESLGPKIEMHSFFPEKTNVEFIEIKDKHHIKMRVWERGAGITKACGTGACASAIVAITQGYCQSPVTVSCDGGDLMIIYNKEKLILSGPYHIVFTGEISI